MRLMVAGQKATRLRANTTAQATRKPRVVIPQVDLVNDLALSNKHIRHFLGVYFRKFKSEVMKRGSNSTNVQNLYSQTFYYKKTPKTVQVVQRQEAIKWMFNILNDIFQYNCYYYLLTYLLELSCVKEGGGFKFFQLNRND